LVKKGKYKFEPKSVWANVSSGAQALVKKMLEVKVPERLAAMEAYHDPWLEEDHLVRPVATGCTQEMIRQMRSFLDLHRLKKVALMVIARSIHDDSIDSLRNLFLSCDKDMSGSIGVEEFEATLVKMEAPESTIAEMKSIMGELVCKSGEVNYTEFLAATMKEHQYLQDGVCRAAFHMLDQDDDGLITKPDLTSLLSSQEKKEEAGLVNLSEADVDGIMASVDENGDGQVTFEEFMNMMHGRSLTKNMVEDYFRAARAGRGRTRERRVEPLLRSLSPS